MAVYQTIFNIILYFSEGLIIFYYANSFFKRKYNTKITIIGISLLHLLLLGFYYANNTILNFIALFVIYCLILSLLYECRFFTALFNAVLLLVIMATCEWCVLFLTSLLLNKNFYAFQDSLPLQMFDITISKLAYYVICLILIRTFSKKGINANNKTFFWQLMIMPISSLFALFVFRYISSENLLSNKANILCSIASLFLLISNVVVFFIYEHSIRNATELYELKAIKQKEEIERQYLDILEQNNKDLKIFTHDIKNHLEQISNLTDNTEISTYISKLYGTVNQYNNVALSGNKTLDVIINKYHTLCANKNIEVTFNVKTANLMDIDNTDLSTILNNALDNAVESAEQSTGKKISVDIYTKKLFEIIKIQNSCDRTPVTANKKLLTSKKEKALHGFGIESIERTINHYDGLFDWSYDEENKVFEITIAIPKSE
ncbi:GHKL domain-containing protein [uncultured Eubacterium sp.]|uniref:sensor histidine kinase n=1 Tax=uncultured Eubacterium sp. TaxID=165185 RepID=UPI0028042AE6|nr:GHKL domain-containing protein [uncultured Eubacterium sp.]